MINWIFVVASTLRGTHTKTVDSAKTIVKTIVLPKSK